MPKQAPGTLSSLAFTVSKALHVHADTELAAWLSHVAVLVKDEISSSSAIVGHADRAGRQPGCLHAMQAEVSQGYMLVHHAVQYGSAWMS